MDSLQRLSSLLSLPPSSLSPTHPHRAAESQMTVNELPASSSLCLLPSLCGSASQSPAHPLSLSLALSLASFFVLVSVSAAKVGTMKSLAESAVRQKDLWRLIEQD